MWLHAARAQATSSTLIGDLPLKFAVAGRRAKAQGNGNCTATSAQPVADHLVAVARCHHACQTWPNFASWMPLRSNVSALVVPPATRAGMRAGRAGALAVATLSRGHFCRYLSAASGCAFAAQTCRVASSFEAATPTSALAGARCARRFAPRWGWPPRCASGDGGFAPTHSGRALGRAQADVVRVHKSLARFVNPHSSALPEMRLPPARPVSLRSTYRPRERMLCMRSPLRGSPAAAAPQPRAEGKSGSNSKSAAGAGAESNANTEARARSKLLAAVGVSARRLVLRTRGSRGQVNRLALTPARAVARPGSRVD